MEEKELLELLKSPKTLDKGFKVLVDEYSERIYWHIRKIVMDHELSNDLTQDTFVKIYQNIDKFKADSKLYSWIYRIATNEALGYLRKEAKNRKVSLNDTNELILENMQADVYFDGDKAEVELQKAIQSLPEKQRLTFQMKYYENMKYKDISDILDTSVGALKASYHHAVKKIEAFVKEKAI